MKKCRIVKRTCVDERVLFVIQQPHFLFRWWWVDAWINSSSGAYCTDSFSTLEEAQKNMYYFDSSLPRDKVIEEYA